METKKCSKCEVEKPFTEFHKGGNNDGLRSVCKDCRSTASKDFKERKTLEKLGQKRCCCCGEIKYVNVGFYMNQNNTVNSYCKSCISDKGVSYRHINKEAIKQRKKEYRAKNICKIKSRGKEYYLANKEKFNERSMKDYQANKEKYKAINRAWVTNNKDRVRNTKKKWKTFNYINSPNFRIKEAYSSRIRMALTKSHTKKCVSSVELMGCSIDFLKSHLEKQFSEGMTWDNHGLYGWHIDHIRPCASFDLTDPEQQKQCFHYTNLQPLWAKDNLSKGDKWEPENATPVF